MSVNKIEGVPEGWELVRIGSVDPGEFDLGPYGDIMFCNEKLTNKNYVIIRKIEPRPVELSTLLYCERLTEQYRLAMRKGAELAISEMMDERKLDDELFEDDSLEGCDGKQYEIKTIDDLLRVPPNRLKDCLAELETSIQICHAMAALTSAGAPTAEVKVEFPSWTWIDDGKRDQNFKYDDLNVELKADTDAKATD